MKPIIGVTSDFNQGDREDMGGKEPTYFLRARYVRAIEDLGGLPVILPLTESPTDRRGLLDSLDGLLLTGSGPDLPPKLYGERQRYPFKLVSDRRSSFELAMAKLALARRLPTLGICGGMQTVNVALGGNLYQDIPAQLDSPLTHRQRQPATELSHTISISPGSLLHRIVKRNEIRVNSSHHQSVKRVASGLMVTGIAPDGVIEAIESSRQPFFLAVQWHPEFLYERFEPHRRLFQALLAAAKSASPRD
ncbi:gamma-glutamyl-gamma-aminobutyrate hydrolase [Nitrospira sp.]|nr:gamma-glutamyl-gamma-aminobutyrate hydrolase [Nitrospira sp.]